MATMSKNNKLMKFDSAFIGNDGEQTIEFSIESGASENKYTLILYIVWLFKRH